MGIRELREKYGKGAGPQVVNRAIAAELVGGEDCLLAMTLSARLADRLRERGHSQQAALASEAHEALCRLHDAMGQIIARRYDLASARMQSEE